MKQLLKMYAIVAMCMHTTHYSALTDEIVRIIFSDESRLKKQLLDDKLDVIVHETSLVKLLAETKQGPDFFIATLNFSLLQLDYDELVYEKTDNQHKYTENDKSELKQLTIQSLLRHNPPALHAIQKRLSPPPCIPAPVLDESSSASCESSDLSLLSSILKNSDSGFE